MGAEGLRRQELCPRQTLKVAALSNTTPIQGVSRISLKSLPPQNRQRCWASPPAFFVPGCMKRHEVMGAITPNCIDERGWARDILLRRRSLCDAWSAPFLKSHTLTAHEDPEHPPRTLKQIALQAPA